jgi:hypothetical protein
MHITHGEIFKTEFVKGDRTGLPENRALFLFLSSIIARLK